MNDFTFSDYHKLNKDERALTKLLHTETEIEKESSKMPSERSVNNILAYSKALSVRKSENLGFVENVLN